MKEEKVVSEATEKKVDPAKHPELIPEPEKNVSPKKEKKLTMDNALLRAIEGEKSLDLYRFTQYNERSRKWYFYYAVFVVFPGTKQNLVRILLTPDIGYIGKKDAYKKTARNSNGYALMNFAYDVGNGLKLVPRSYKKDDGSVSFQYVACSSDETGVGFESVMVADNPADFNILKCAYIGYGNCHGLAFEDREPYMKKYSDLFENYLEPGQYPEGDTSDDISDGIFD